MDLPVVELFVWWLVFFGGGVALFPLTAKMFAKSSDLGYPFSKILFLSISPFIFWTLGSYKIVSFREIENYYLLFPAIFIFSFLVFREGRIIRKLLNKKIIKTIFLEEALFSFAFIAWAVVRSREPSLESLEKFMDFGIINSILRSDFLPPKDMWLSGFNLNYYYFGHFVVAFLIKLSKVVPEIGYNLTLASLFGITLIGTLSIGLNLWDPKKVGSRIAVSSAILSGLFLTLFGNLHPILAPFKPISSYWYPDATRFIERTIHEFPSYSFIVADLHGHLLDIPFVLIAIILILKIWKHLKINTLDVILLSLLSAEMYMTNSVDAIIFLGIIILTILITLVLTKKNELKGISSKEKNPLKTIIVFYIRAAKIFFPIILLITLFTVFSFPFLLTFTPFIEGIKIATESSPLWQLLILWGGFLVFALPFLFFLVLNHNKNNSQTNHLTENEESRVNVFVGILICVSISLIIFPELFYFEDIYKTQPRANTMFKLGYQAFIFFGIVTPFVYFRMLISGKNKIGKVTLILLGVVILSVSAVYPIFSVKGYYGITPKKLGLNGIDYLKTKYPDDYNAILFIKKNISGQPVIVEAVGESYTNFARVSANTGLPTVLGWPVHEWLWRKSNKYQDLRSPDIETIYKTKNESELKKMIGKYKVQYVFVGTLERQKYGEIFEDTILKVASPVFSSGKTTLYKISNF